MAERDDKREALPAPDPMRMVRIGGFLLALVLGWVFILYSNKFEITPPVVFVCLGYLALVSAIYALWRTGVVVADENEDYADSTWVRSAGARGELEREKKSLLKAIKETEFDREMGKLSKADADQMIVVYRARAIEVIKELDQMGTGEGTVREQIMREVRARIEIERKTTEAKKKPKAKKAPAAKPATAAAAVPDTAAEPDTDTAADAAAATDLAARVEGAAS